MSNKTATAYDLADFKTRLAMQNEDVSDLIVEDNSDLGEGPYKGSIISYETETFALGKKIVALIRINGLHNSLIPINKCRDSPANINQFSEKQDMMLVGNHISAVSRFYATDTESNPINYTNLENLIIIPTKTPSTEELRVVILPEADRNYLTRSFQRLVCLIAVLISASCLIWIT